MSAFFGPTTPRSNFLEAHDWRISEWHANAPSWSWRQQEWNNIELLDWLWDRSRHGIGSATSVGGIRTIRAWEYRRDWSGTSGLQPQTFPSVLDGTVAPAAALVKQVAIMLAGGMTPSGALVKQVAHPLAGSETPTGALSKQAILAKLATITPVATLDAARIIPPKSVDGTVTSSGTLSRRVSDSETGTVAPTGSVVPRVEKVLTAGEAPAATLLRYVMKSLAAEVIPAGEIVKNVVKTFSGSVTPSGDFIAQKVFLIDTAGVVTPSAVVLRRVNKMLDGVVAPSATLPVIIDLAVSFSAEASYSANVEIEGEAIPSGPGGAGGSGAAHYVVVEPRNVDPHTPEVLDLVVSFRADSRYTVVTPDRIEPELLPVRREPRTLDLAARFVARSTQRAPVLDRQPIVITLQSSFAAESSYSASVTVIPGDVKQVQDVLEIDELLMILDLIDA